ncbi:unknown [Eggerthella sp. CAG:1427]|nr:unknown [Eggerthella sp. CAG:1427]
MADSSNNQSYSLISVEKAKKRSFEDPMPASVGIDTSAVASSSEKENSVSRASQSSAELTSPDAQEVSEPLDVQEASKPRAAQKPSNSPEAKKFASSEESALDNLTEEDLQGSAPLENMHKIILVVLILALIVFGVYFFVFM